MSLLRLSRWFRRAPGEDVLARWRVEPALWREFVASESRRPPGPVHDEARAEGEAPPEGFEVVVERDAVWLAGRRIALPVRGTPEVLGAELRDPADAPTTIEWRLKHPMYAAASGALRPPAYTRLAVPVPGPAWREARRVVAHFNGNRAAPPDFFHGRGDGSDPEDLSRCMNCGFETYRLRSECERCGTPLQSRRWSRRFGAVLVLCGLVISGLMGVVLLNVAPLLLSPGVSIDGSRFTGSPLVAILVLVLLSAVFVFGVATLAYGAWQVATGKRSLRVARFAALLLGGLMMLAGLLQW